MSLIERIEKYAQQYPLREALQFDEQKYTYQALVEEIRIASDLFAVLPQGTYVALDIKDPFKMMKHYLGLHKSGCVPCVIDAQWPQDRKTALMQQYEIPVVVTEVEGKISLEETHVGVIKVYDDRSHLLHIGFTSGTTGMPKAYYRDAHSWLCSYEQNERLWQAPVTQLVAPGPLAHSLSLYVSIYALYFGYRFVGQSKFDAQTLAKILEQSVEDSALFVVPTMLHGLNAVVDRLDNVTHVLTTGYKLDDKVYDALSTQYPNAHTIEFFGASETSFISYNLNRTAPTASVGRPFDNVQVKLAGKNDEDIGQLIVTSDMVFPGYVGQQPVVGNTIVMGDIAYIDTSGYLFLKGREHDMMIIGGKNIYPSEIERVVGMYDDVDEVIVLGVPHHRFGEVAMMLYTGSGQLEYQDVKQDIQHQLSRYHVPSKIVRLRQMRYTSSGKIARQEMKQAYMEGKLDLWENQ